MNMLQSVGRQLRAVANQYQYLGPILWILSLQYFVVQAVVAAAWPRAYSWSNNLISDLGNTTCEVFNGVYVCSPLAWLMNLSFVIFGVTIMTGSVLIYQAFYRSQWTRLGFSLMITAGVGTVMVGLFPQNENELLHAVGAFAGLVLGNVSILVLALSLHGLRRAFRWYMIATSLVCLGAFVLFFSEIDLGIGRGNMERIISYPFTIWMMNFGIYMTFVRLRAGVHIKERLG